MLALETILELPCVVCLHQAVVVAVQAKDEMKQRLQVDEPQSESGFGSVAARV